MRVITLSDTTLRSCEQYRDLPFRLKVEIAGMLDEVGVGVIETCAVPDGNTEYFLTKSLASSTKAGVLAVPVDMMDPQSPVRTWEAVKEAAHPRLQVRAPMSVVQMEYICHRKPAGILQAAGECVAACAALCSDVEFVAEDFTRSDEDFLLQALQGAIAAGARTVTLSDAAGNLLPEEMRSFIQKVRAALPEDIRLGVQCCNSLFLADACALAAVQGGADEIKLSVGDDSTTSLQHFPIILQSLSKTCGDVCAAGADLTLLEHV